jgi:hypothetical protein
VPGKGALPVLLLALLCAAAFAGCAGSADGEDTAVSALARAPVVGGFVSQLKQEDDESEQQAIRENAPRTPEERAEAREQAEAAAASSESGDSSESGAADEGEAEGEGNGEGEAEAEQS